MKLTYRQINTALEQFDRLTLQQATPRLMQAIAENACRLEDAQDRFKHQRDLLQRSHIATDDEGEFIRAEDGQGFKIADQQAFQDEYQDLLDTDVEVDVMQVSASEVAQAGFSGRVLGRLKFMVDFEEHTPQPNGRKTTPSA